MLEDKSEFEIKDLEEGIQVKDRMRPFEKRVCLEDKKKDMSRPEREGGSAARP